MIFKFNNSFYACCILILLGCACNQHLKDVEPYIDEINSFRQERLKQLKAPDGWTTLVGLYWLKEGANFAGSASENDLKFPNKMPKVLGQFDLINDEVFFTSNIKVSIDSTEPAYIDNFQLKADITGDPTYLTWNNYQWYLIKRGLNYGIRLKDSLYPIRFLLDTIPHYSNDMKWRIKATVSYQDTHRTVNINNVVGLSNASKIAATLTFKVKEQPQKLFAINGGSDAFFVIFADLTTGDATYGGGRYLYPEKPKQGIHTTYLDFNRAINPPCVFTAFATCPLPPPENKLSIAIESGEKYLAIGEVNH